MHCDQATHLYITGGKPCSALQALELSGVCDCDVCQLFGDVYIDSTDCRHLSSRLVVHDALLPVDTNVVVRDGVGIQRENRAAADARKFDYEVISPGTPILLQMEANPKDEQQEQLFAALLAEIGEGRISFGGRSAQGLGRVSLESVEARVIPSLHHGNIADWVDLLGQDDWFQSTGFSAEWYRRRLQEARELVSRKLPKYLSLSARLDFEDAFLTEDSFLAVASGDDAVPLLMVQEENREHICLAPRFVVRCVHIASVSSVH